MADNLPETSILDQDSDEESSNEELDLDSEDEDFSGVFNVMKEFDKDSDSDSVKEQSEDDFKIDTKGDGVMNDLGVKTSQVSYYKSQRDFREGGSICLKDTERKHNRDVESSSESSDDEYRPTRDKHKYITPAKQEVTLSTTLEDDLGSQEYYTKPDISKVGSKKTLLSKLMTSTSDELMKKSVLSKDLEKQHTLPCYQDSLRAARKRRQRERANSKGKSWFNMTAQEMTEEHKNDLKVLQMRHVLNPKSFYKRNDLKVLPKFYQMGKVVEHAADFYSSRIPKKQRKQTLVDELLADMEFTKYNKRKYTEAIGSRTAHRDKIKFGERLKFGKKKRQAEKAKKQQNKR